MATGFSPRKQRLSLYLMSGFDKYQDLMSKLGKPEIGKSCLYINKLDDVGIEVLHQLMSNSFKHIVKTQSGC
jgi:hypothetical protein